MDSKRHRATGDLQRGPVHHIGVPHGVRLACLPAQPLATAGLVSQALAVQPLLRNMRRSVLSMGGCLGGRSERR